MAERNDGVVQLMVRVPADVRDEIKILSIRRGRLMQEEVLAALRAHLADARREQRQQEAS